MVYMCGASALSWAFSPNFRVKESCLVVKHGVGEGMSRPSFYMCLSTATPYSEESTEVQYGTIVAVGFRYERYHE